MDLVCHSIRPPVTDGGVGEKASPKSDGLGVEKNLRYPRGKVPTQYDISTCSSPSQICTPTMMGSSLSGSTAVYLWIAQAVGRDLLTRNPATLDFSHIDLPLSHDTERAGSSFSHTAEGGNQVFLADTLFLHSGDESRPGPAIRPFPPERAWCVEPAIFMFHVGRERA